MHGADRLFWRSEERLELLLHPNCTQIFICIRRFICSHTQLLPVYDARQERLKDTNSSPCTFSFISSRFPPWSTPKERARPS